MIEPDGQARTGTQVDRRPRRPRTRPAVARAAVASLLAGLGTAAGGWYLTRLLERQVLQPEHAPDPPDLVVTAITEGSVTLAPAARARPVPDWERRGTYGLAGSNGYGRIGSILDARPDRVTREFSLVAGTIGPGDPVRTDPYAFAGDPREAHDIHFADVMVPGPLGAYPAWYVEATREDTWVLLVHGKNTGRQEMLRALATVHRAGLSALVVSYRNDADAPASPSGRLQYGAEEWEDLEAAMRFALDRGAERLVLLGHSMGGAIAMAALSRSALGPRVVAAVLDAPMSDLGAIIDFQSDRLGVPAPVTRLTRWLAGRRFGLDWAALDYTAAARRIDIPVLVLHGDDDDLIPVTTSVRLVAEGLPRAELLRVPGARHVRAWNVDPGAYESAVGGFLRRVADGG